MKNKTAVVPPAHKMTDIKYGVHVWCKCGYFAEAFGKGARKEAYMEFRAHLEQHKHENKSTKTQ
jgi:hypothetical protein